LIKKVFKKEISMISLNLPSILVPLVGLVFPAIAMASLFLYIEKEELS
jgi:photosystem I subunit 8